MVELKDITKYKHYKKQVKKLYLSAFGPNERPPFRMLWRKAKKGKGDFYAAVDGEIFVGLAHTITHGSLVYLAFLAIENNLRGKGYGSKVLEIIKNIYRGKNIILCIEEIIDNAPNYSERLRRKAFYERSGFSISGIKSVEAGVRYDILTSGYPITYGEYASLMKCFSGKLLFKLIFRQG